MTIIEILKERLKKLDNKPEFIPVCLGDLQAYIDYKDIGAPVTFIKKGSGEIKTYIGNLPLKCSFKGIPLRCFEDASKKVS